MYTHRYVASLATEIVDCTSENPDQLVNVNEPFRNVVFDAQDK